MTADSPAVVTDFAPQLEQARGAFLSAGQEEVPQSKPGEQRTFFYDSAAKQLAEIKAGWVA